MCAILMNIAYVDWKYKLIRNKSVLIVFAMSIISMLIFSEISSMDRLAGSIAVSVPLLILSGLLDGGIGGGDIKLMAAAGLGLGVAGIWMAFVIGVFSSGIYVMVMLLRKKFDRKTEIALGPFLCLGLILVWMM